jgi:hypothetical protein
MQEDETFSNSIAVRCSRTHAFARAGLDRRVAHARAAGVASVSLRFGNAEARREWLQVLAQVKEGSVRYGGESFTELRWDQRGAAILPSNQPGAVRAPHLRFPKRRESEPHITITSTELGAVMEIEDEEEWGADKALPDPQGAGRGLRGAGHTGRLSPPPRQATQQAASSSMLPMLALLPPVRQSADFGRASSSPAASPGERQPRDRGAIGIGSWT